MAIKNQALRAPHTSGVYFFKNQQGTILYIGKAANLRARLFSYFRPEALDPRKRAMVKE
ncbi:MAG: nucleotide excision repair endonuclease, partial [Candidatus Niyogibacteria bacterium]|nr:nucleotide excision repair endonuclease [Candidatus Niyogibacteria bacterium]